VNQELGNGKQRACFVLFERRLLSSFYRLDLQGDMAAQCTPVPLPSFSHVILALALGHEHSLALTTSGDVISWGSNRFAQLGYVVEGSSKDLTGKGGNQSQILSVPRRVGSLLRVHSIIGVAACRIASACWNEQGVFTWGTNQGQLGALYQHQHHMPFC
jgi:alpha-tubulin suppressor-like RCC1 family protein